MSGRHSSSRPHTRPSNTRTAGVLAAAAALIAILGACGREITEPVNARTTMPGERAAFTVTHAATWDGHTIAIESRQVNSAGQTVCLDLPPASAYSVFWSNAASGRDVIYAPCNYGPTQQFVLSAWDAGYGGSWVVVKPVSNQSVCLDIRGRTSNGGERLQLFTCEPLSNPSWYQTFLFQGASSPSAVGLPLVSPICVRAGGLSQVLDVPLPAGVSGYVQQYLLNRGENQVWRFKDIRSGHYFISPTGSVRIHC